MNTTELHSIVLSWYAKQGREFIWRSENPDPYIVLLSEIMLQQTQTSRVQEKLPQFLRQFSSIHDLAKASNAEIIIAWQGMGYNNRALRLRDCAKSIVEQFAGIIPDDFSLLIQLPGIGQYTASAICAFVYKQDIGIVDVNIHRIYSRLLGLASVEELSAKQALTVAHEWNPSGKSSEWHQALMDIGALYCKAVNPQCGECPLREKCLFQKQDLHLVRTPKKQKKSEPSHKGIPNRIWRGKLVELLRNSPAKEMIAAHALQILMQENPQKVDIQWFENNIIAGLVKDSIVMYSETKGTLQFDDKK